VTCRTRTAHCSSAGGRIPAFAERDPATLPWADLGVDLVLECTGVFTSEDDLTKHPCRCVVRDSSRADNGGECATVVHG
jgi:glyceraldehyde 3-phosphate dehydrogenase